MNILIDNVKRGKHPNGFMARTKDNPKSYYFIGDDTKGLVVNYKEQILSLIDEMIDKDDNSYAGECIFNVLTDLKQQIKKL